MAVDPKQLLWTEKYRPNTVAECILPPRLKEYFQEMARSGNLANMTLTGGPGTGKTTVAKALCNDLGYDVLVINASDERNIDTIRTTVRNFGSSVSLTSNMKCIILDESDHLTPVAQAALRHVIEEFHKTCRFILTCNFPNKMIDPLLSRCPLVDFSYTKEEKEDLVFGFAKRLKIILSEENVTYDMDQLMAVVIKNFPDFRKTLNLIQRYVVNGEFKVSNSKSMADVSIDDLVKYLAAKDFTKMRKWVADNFNNDGVTVRRQLYNALFHILEPASVPEAILLLAQYDYKEAFVADKEVNMVAMMCEIMASCQFKE